MKQGFNLLKPQVEAPSIWTTFYKWVVGTARIILIVTETAVMVALVIRIVIDVQGKDLDEKISNYESIIKVRSEEEKKYVTLQTKTTDYRDSFDKNLKYASQLNDFIKNIPNSFSDIDLSIINNKISFRGKAPNTDIKTMENYLKSSILYINSQLTTFDTGQTQNNVLLSDFNFETEFKGLPLRQLITDNTVN